MTGWPCSPFCISVLLFYIQVDTAYKNSLSPPPPPSVKFIDNKAKFFKELIYILETTPVKIATSRAVTISPVAPAVSAFICCRIVMVLLQLLQYGMLIIQLSSCNLRTSCFRKVSHETCHSLQGRLGVSKLLQTMFVGFPFVNISRLLVPSLCRVLRMTTEHQRELSDIKISQIWSKSLDLVTESAIAVIYFATSAMVAHVKHIYKVYGDLINMLVLGSLKKVLRYSWRYIMNTTEWSQLASQSLVLMRATLASSKLVPPHIHIHSLCKISLSSGLITSLIFVFVLGTTCLLFWLVSVHRRNKATHAMKSSKASMGQCAFFTQLMVDNALGIASSLVECEDTNFGMYPPTSITRTRVSTLKRHTFSLRAHASRHGRICSASNIWLFQLYKFRWMLVLSLILWQRAKLGLSLFQLIILATLTLSMTCIKLSSNQSGLAMSYKIPSWFQREKSIRFITTVSQERVLLGQQLVRSFQNDIRSHFEKLERECDGTLDGSFPPNSSEILFHLWHCFGPCSSVSQFNKT
jgi:hypothetical protein